MNTSDCAIQNYKKELAKVSKFSIGKKYAYLRDGKELISKDVVLAYLTKKKKKTA